jgi:hypothetical protein
MTHEYIIATGGRIGSSGSGGVDAEGTAIAWAADRVLAVGSDEAVCSISRGDSTFLDLGGCVVTALPVELDRADALIRGRRPHAPDIQSLLVSTGLLRADATLEAGSPADLAFWTDAGPSDRIPGHRPGLAAVVRGGVFAEGDVHRGPFSAPQATPIAPPPASPSPARFASHPRQSSGHDR